MTRKMLLLGLSVGLGTMLLGGCASDDGTARLNVHRSQSDEQYVASFDRAVFSETKNGQVDLILLSGGAGVAQGSQPVLASADQSGGDSGVKEIIHLRVLWEPTRTIHLDSPSASNTSVDWHIIADANDRISYTGYCWAMVNIDGDEAKIDLRNATVSVSQVLGNMQDPLKRAQLSGKFIATRSDAMVRSYLMQLAAIDHSSATALVTP